MKIFRIATALYIASLLLIGCAHAPMKKVFGYTPAIGENAARIAATMIGRPYKYRGESPAGFDCSGLVRYSYLTAGIAVPRGTKELRNATRSVGSSMRKGDLLFFNESSKKYSHVGIYVGNEFFVHAPSTGKTVKKESLQDPYWKNHFLDARRLN